MPEQLAEAMTHLAETLLSPRVLGLRQLLVGELARFPPSHRIITGARQAGSSTAGARRSGGCAARRPLALDDERLAAEQLAFLAFGASLDEAMLRPPAARADAGVVSRKIQSGVRVFLAATSHSLPTHRRLHTELHPPARRWSFGTCSKRMT
jgi:hypothetical protein